MHSLPQLTTQIQNQTRPKCQDLKKGHMWMKKHMVPVYSEWQAHNDKTVGVSDLLDVTKQESSRPKWQNSDIFQVKLNSLVASNIIFKLLYSRNNVWMKICVCLQNIVS